ncbi:hypothetical protein EV286_103269 [Rhizobium sp. BK251]|nr:hypothetical protein EV286_103269 [Rhizobium sp. BK251]
MARLAFISFLVAYLADIAMNVVLAANNLPTVMTAANGSLIALLACSLGEAFILWVHGFIVGVIFFWLRRKSKSQFRGLVASTVSIALVAAAATGGAFLQSDHKSNPPPAPVLRSSIG